MPLGVLEILVILLIILILFGSKKLPELARSIGEAVSEFRKGMRGGKR
ncbi:MAG: twin-arginine translocase TatA/TatE family subunit [Candidatus Hydrothermota bacterium]|nr:MAG: twin-arginine translocase TatA/TatE family subunit [Candidatus Hydrothermae bacterium]